MKMTRKVYEIHLIRANSKTQRYEGEWFLGLKVYERDDAVFFAKQWEDFGYKASIRVYEENSE